MQTARAAAATSHHLPAREVHGEADAVAEDVEQRCGVAGALLPLLERRAVDEADADKNAREARDAAVAGTWMAALPARRHNEHRDEEVRSVGRIGRYMAQLTELPFGDVHDGGDVGGRREEGSDGRRALCEPSDEEPQQHGCSRPPVAALLRLVGAPAAEGRSQVLQDARQEELHGRRIARWNQQRDPGAGVGGGGGGEKEGGPCGGGGCQNGRRDQWDEVGDHEGLDGAAAAAG